VKELPAVEMVHLTVQGPYTNLEDAYSQLFGCGYSRADTKLAGTFREVYVKWGEEMLSE